MIHKSRLWTICALGVGLISGCQGLAIRGAIEVKIKPTGLQITGGNLQNGIVATALSQPLEVGVFDSDSLPVEGKLVSFAILSGTGNLSSASAVTDATGKASVTLTFGTIVGARQVQASIGGLPAVTFTATAGAAAPDHLTVTSNPAPAAGACAGSVVVEVRDPYGNLTSFGTSKSVSLSGLGTGALYDAADPTCAGTAYTTSYTLAASTPIFSLRFKGSDAAAYTVPIGIAGITATSASFTVSSAAASQLLFTQIGATGTAATQLATQPIVKVADAYGNLIGSGTSAVTLSLYPTLADCQAGTNAINSNLASGASISGTNPQTTTGGTTMFTNIALTRAAPTASGAVGDVFLRASNGTQSGCSAAIAMSGAAAASVSVSGYTSGADACTTQTVLVRAIDAYGNDASSYTGTVVFSGKPANVHASDVLPADYTFVASDLGRHSFTGVAFRKAATDHFVHITDGTLAADQTPITVVGCASSKLSLTAATAPPTDVEAAACSTVFHVCRQDSYGNLSAVASALSMTTSGRGSGGFYTSNACTGGTSNSPSIAASTSCIDLYFKDSVGEQVTLNFNATSHTSATQTLNVNGQFLAASINAVTNDIYGDISLADMNNDGILDLVGGSGNVRIRLGTNVAPWFGAETQTAARPGLHNNPNRIDTGDINGDGNIDVVALSGYASANMYVGSYLGDGMGGVAAMGWDSNMGGAYPWGASNNPLDLRLIDVDGDGDLDLAVDTQVSHTLILFTNNGTGGFTKSAEIDIGAGRIPIAMNVVDLNNDGKIDIVMGDDVNGIDYCLNTHPNAGTAISNASFLCFTTPSNSTGGNPLSITSGDLNGDGFADVASAEIWSGSISVFINDGTGGFPATRSYLFYPASYPQAIQIGDFDGDGKNDIASLSASPAQITLFKNISPAAGLLGTPTYYKACPTNGNSMELKMGYLNGPADTKLDLVAACYNSSTANARYSVHIGR